MLWACALATPPYIQAQVDCMRTSPLHKTTFGPQSRSTAAKHPRDGRGSRYQFHRDKGYCRRVSQTLLALLLALLARCSSFIGRRVAMSRRPQSRYIQYSIHASSQPLLVRMACCQMLLLVLMRRPCVATSGEETTNNAHHGCYDE